MLRLFGSQKAFFLACLDEMEVRVRDTFGVAAAVDRPEALDRMGDAFRDLASDGAIPGLWLRASALAREDKEVAARCRQLLAGVLDEASALSGADSHALADFLARGALVVFLQAIGADLSDGSAGAIGALLREDAR